MNAKRVKKAGELAAETQLTDTELAEIVNNGIRREGKHIILPADPAPGMGFREGARALIKKAEQEEQIVDAHELIEGNPFDALAAFHHVLTREFGWATVGKHTIQTFFGPQKIPPQIINVKTGPKPEDIIQVPMGEMSAPGLDFGFHVNFDKSGLHLKAECQMHQAKVLKTLATMVVEHLKGHSIYKGKAFKMPARWNDQPTFVSFDHVREEELVLSKPVEDAVLVNLYTPLKHREQVKADGTPIKRTIVLSGIYGTGKSLTISCAAKIALQAGWTVIYLDDTADMATAFENAKRWQPCMVCAEDVDRVASDRNDKANHIFNTLSGVLGTNSEVVTVLTTNHPENIDRAMLRPGRIDALIEVTPPDATAVQTLIRLYARGKMIEGVKLDKVGELLAGQIPATIREVAERSKLARIAFRKEAIDEQALLAAIHSMGPQITLLNSAKAEQPPVIDTALRNLVETVATRACMEALAVQDDLADHLGVSAALRKKLPELRN